MSKVLPVESYCVACNEGSPKHHHHKKSSRCCLYALGALCLLFFISTIVLIVVIAKTCASLLILGVMQEEEVERRGEEPDVSWPPPSISPLGEYYRAAVAAPNVICSDIGRDVLMQGGSAVDAGIAAIVCTGVMDPQSSGIGGGHFSTIYNATTRECTIIDARERAPINASMNMFTGKNQLKATVGWLSIAVPGEIAGLYEAYKLGGRLPWQRLLAPSVDLLEYGYPVSEALARGLLDMHSFLTNEKTMELWMNPGTKQLYKAGEIMKRPMLAATLRQLAESADPAHLFYNGSIGQAILAQFAQHGSIMTEEDLRQYTALIRPTIVSEVGTDLAACGPPPPSSAALAMAVFNIFSGYGFSKEANLSSIPAATATYHKFVEAMKFVYAERSNLGDLSFGEGNLTLAEHVASEAFAEKIRGKITDRTHPSEYYGGSYIKADHGTSHISVVDPLGNAMSTTSTINLLFGSQRRCPTTGIIWNDEMDDFSTPGLTNAFGYEPSAANFIYPGKRPQSSMSPIVFFHPSNGQVEMVVGAAGGSRIISSTAYVAIRTLIFNETVKEAVDAPRLHHQLLPHNLFLEHNDDDDEPNRFPQEYASGLEALGHNVSWARAGSVVSAIHRRGRRGGIQANSDFRKGSTAASAGF